MTAAPLEEAAVAAAVSRAGLAFRGGFELLPAEQAEFSPFKAIALIGMTEARHFCAFTAAPEFCDGLPDPLDRWSRRVIESLARQFDAKALFPFDGPPYLPFQRWARRAEECFPSPIGLFIHPDYGLWHSFRGALAIAEKLSSSPCGKRRRESPCERCADRPCLSACPVGAFTPGGYDVKACVTWLRSEEGRDCRDHGCLARRACPVGRERAYAAEQARFHMDAFVAKFSGL